MAPWSFRGGFAYSLLPTVESPTQETPTEKKIIPTAAKRDLRWIEGLRGIAAVVVVCYHTMMAWHFQWMFPAMGQDAPSEFMQRPVIRILVSGQIAIPIFAFVTGYVCALKPLRMIWQENQDACFKALQQSTLRRFPRMMLPPLIALLITWTLTQLGAFTAASHSGSPYQRFATAPTFEGGFLVNLYHLWKNILGDWITDVRMVYDDYHWAILPLLKCSLEVYICLLVIMNMKFRYRITTYLLVITYWWLNPINFTETFAMQTFLGMLACDISLHPKFQSFIDSRLWLNTIIPIFALPLGLYLASYPYNGPEFAPWSRNLKDLAAWIFPTGSQPSKRYTAIGFDFIALAIFLNPFLKRLISGKIIVWLGQISFAIYLVHGALLRTVLTWLLVGISGQPWDETQKDAEDKPIPPKILEPSSKLKFLYAIPIFWACVLVCATLWEKYVEAWCEKVTARLEKRVSRSLGRETPMVI